MKKKLIDKCYKYLEKGKIDKLENYIIKNNLKKQLLEELFFSTYGAALEGEKYQQVLNLSNLALKIFMEDLKEKYGEKLSSKLEQIMFNTANLGIRNTNLIQLIELPKKQLTETEENLLCNILEICTDKNNIVGTHVTGGTIGEILLKEGVELTGHKFLAFDYDSLEYKKDIKSTLDKNVTFFTNDPIGLIMQLFTARGYNNYVTEFNDIMIVSIPKDKLSANKEGIVIEKDGVKYLSSKYIKGFVRINAENGDIESFNDNSLFEEQHKKEDIIDLNQDDWKEKFKKWYEQAKEPKMQEKKTGVIDFLRDIAKKRKALRDEFENDFDNDFDNDNDLNDELDNEK